jgi:hypothetical protein
VKKIYSDQKVVRNIHNNPIAPEIQPGMVTINCEEAANKAKQSKTLQQNTHKDNREPSQFPPHRTTNEITTSTINFSICKRITTQSFQRKHHAHVYTVANLKKTQTNTLLSQRSFHTQSKFMDGRKEPYL